MRERAWPRSQVQAVLVALLVFGVYLLGACRTIYVGDSGELVTAAAILGIPHPSGYPLFVLLGKAWITLVPVGSVAFRMSLFSGFFGALATGVLYLAVRRHGGSWIAAAVGSLSLALAPSFWSQATIQRVYTLNGFFVVVVLACALEWWRGGDRADADADADADTDAAGARPIRWLVLAALAAGLGACNHTVMGVVGLGVGVFAIAVEPAMLRRPREIVACVGAGLAGLLPYLYMPWRSAQDPRLDWGNPETFTAFKEAVLRSDFWGRAWMESPRDWIPIAADFLGGIGQETLWVGAVLALVGALALGVGRRERLILLPPLIIGANLVIVGLHGSRSDIFIWHRYYIPAYVMVALLIAWGCDVLVRRWHRGSKVLLLLPVALLLNGWNRFDRSDFRIAEDFSRQLMASLPPGAHLAASDDNILFVLMYLHLVEGVRPDVDLVMQGVGGADLGSLRFDPDDDPLFFTHYPNWNMNGLDVVPVGLAFRTVRTGTGAPVSLPERELDGAWDAAVPKDYLASNLVGHFHYMLGLTHESTEWPRARAEFLRAGEAAPGNDVLFYNLGLIYRRNGMVRRSFEAFERAQAINGRHIPSNEKVRSSDRVEEMRAELARAESLERRLLPSASGELSSQEHLALAQSLDRAGETLMAKGHRLRAMETRSGLGLRR